MLRDAALLTPTQTGLISMLAKQNAPVVDQHVIATEALVFMLNCS